MSVDVVLMTTYWSRYMYAKRRMIETFSAVYICHILEITIMDVSARHI